jgi:hypothetical protein
MMVDVQQSAGVLMRWSRALMLGTVAMAAGVIAHRTAAGLMPGPTALALLFVACVGVAGLFLGRPASRLRVVLLVVAGQTFIHGGLTALAGHRGDPVVPRAAPVRPVPELPPPVGGGRRVGSLMDQYYANRPTGQRVELSVPYPVQHLIADVTGPHVAMALGHLSAAVVVGLWLAMGERALWAVLAMSADVAARALVLVVKRSSSIAAAVQMVATTLDGPTSRRLLPAPLDRQPPEHLVSRSVERRGPPPALSV